MSAGPVIYVDDEGLSILTDKHETVYVPSHSSASGGTGFGLSIVRWITEAHGSDVDIIEVSAGGSRFESSGVWLEPRWMTLS
jgi:signal transduction histidine kinase